MSTCKDCQAEITWKKFNPDGSPHVCKKAEKAQPVCKYCGKPIAWALLDGRYTPVVDGKRHDCRREKYEADRKAQEAKDRLARRERWRTAHSGELRERGAVLRQAAEIDREFKEATR